MRQHFKLKVVTTNDVVCVEDLAAAEEELAVCNTPAIHHVALVVDGQPPHLFGWHRCIVGSSGALDFYSFVVSHWSSDF